MPSYTIYPTSDGYGFSRSGSASSNGTWNNSRAGTGDGFGGSSSDTNSPVGGRRFLQSGFTNYDDYLQNHEYDTSSVVGTITAASFNVYMSLFSVSPVPTIQWRIVNWSSVTSFTNATAYEAATLLATAQPAGSDGYKVFTVSNPAQITISPAFKVAAADAKHVSGTSPTNNAAPGCYMIDDAGTSRDPYLAITTVTGFKRSFAGLVQ